VLYSVENLMPPGVGCASQPVRSTSATWRLPICLIHNGIASTCHCTSSKLRPPSSIRAPRGRVDRTCITSSTRRYPVHPYRTRPTTYLPNRTALSLALLLPNGTARPEIVAMSLPSFPEDSSSPVLVDFPMRGGTGDHLPVWLLACCGAFTAVGECEAVFRSGLAALRGASSVSYLGDAGGTGRKDMLGYGPDGRSAHRDERDERDETLTLSLQPPECPSCPSRCSSRITASRHYSARSSGSC
jgi:hypothetical protein